jgi:hypothetical protein
MEINPSGEGRKRGPRSAKCGAEKGQTGDQAIVFPRVSLLRIDTLLSYCHTNFGWTLLFLKVLVEDLFPSPFVV